MGSAATTPPVRRARTGLARLLLAGLLCASPGLAVSSGAAASARGPTAAGPVRPEVTRVLPSLNAAAAASNVTTILNARRRERGLAPLVTAAALASAAQGHANYMASIGRMTHTGAGGTSVGTRVTRAGYRWSMVGENIAYGQSSSSAVVAAWMASAPHAANMLNARFTQVGVGVASRNGVLWWCLVLARPG